MGVLNKAEMVAAGGNEMIGDWVTEAGYAARDAYQAGANLFNRHDPDVALGYYVMQENGNLNLSLSGGSKYHASGWIPVQPGVTYARGDLYGQFSFYDSARTFLMGGSTATMTAPPGAAFLRVSIRRDAWESYWLGVSGTISGWKPFGDGTAPVKPNPFGNLRRTRYLLQKRALGEAAQAIITVAGDSYSQNASRWVQGFAEQMVARYGDAGGGWVGFGFYSAGTTPYALGGNQPIGVNGNARASLYPVKYAGSMVASYNSTVSPDLALITLSTAGDAVEVGFPAAPVLSGVDLLFVGTADGVIRYSWDGGSTWSANVNVQGTVGTLQSEALTGFPAGAGTLRIERVSGSPKLCGVNLKSGVSGVRVNKIAGSGSQAASWRDQNAAQWQAGLMAIGADLFVYMDGPNSQSSNITQEAWGGYVDELLATRVRGALPGCDILLATPPENQRTTNSVPIAAYAAEAMLRSVRNGYACLDLQPAFGDGGNPEVYGSAGAIPLFNADNLHPDPSTGGRLMLSEFLRAIQGSMS